jgi:hypothetical protein
MVTSNGGHPLHHHLRHSDRLSNSLCCQANLHTVDASLRTVVHPQWPFRPLISTPADRVQSYLNLYVLGLSRSRTCINKKNQSRKNQLQVSAPSWQHRSQIFFYIKKYNIASKNQHSLKLWKKAHIRHPYSLGYFLMHV